MIIGRKRNKKVSQAKRKKRNKNKPSFWKSKLRREIEKLKEINEAILLHVEVEDILRARELAEERAKKGLGWYIV